MPNPSVSRTRAVKTKRPLGRHLTRSTRRFFVATRYNAPLLHPPGPLIPDISRVLALFSALLPCRLACFCCFCCFRVGRRCSASLEPQSCQARPVEQQVSLLTSPNMLFSLPPPPPPASRLFVCFSHFWHGGFQLKITSSFLLFLSTLSVTSPIWPIWPGSCFSFPLRL